MPVFIGDILLDGDKTILLFIFLHVFFKGMNIRILLRDNGLRCIVGIVFDILIYFGGADIFKVLLG